MTGGYVYRGTRRRRARRSIRLRGLLLRHDLDDLADGRRRPRPRRLLLSTSMNISGFGEDQAGELYVLDHGGGTLYRFDAS